MQTQILIRLQSRLLVRSIHPLILMLAILAYLLLLVMVSFWLGVYFLWSFLNWFPLATLAFKFLYLMWNGYFSRIRLQGV